MFDQECESLKNEPRDFYNRRVKGQRVFLVAEPLRGGGGGIRCPENKKYRRTEGRQSSFDVHIISLFFGTPSECTDKIN